MGPLGCEQGCSASNSVPLSLEGYVSGLSISPLLEGRLTCFCTQLSSRRAVFRVGLFPSFLLSLLLR
jgi:hypothetical protein